MPVALYRSWLADHLSEQQFERYKHASQLHQNAGADRCALGTTPCDPSNEHLVAVSLADAALEVTRAALDSARAAYMRDRDPTV
jgi:hypothetical protein